jgi:cytochrome d ubiquinol oxidase subunit I
VLASLITFTLLYGVLAVVEVKLMFTYIGKGAESAEELVSQTEPPDGDDADRPLAFAY